MTAFQRTASAALLVFSCASCGGCGKSTVTIAGPDGGSTANGSGGSNSAGSGSVGSGAAGGSSGGASSGGGTSGSTLPDGGTFTGTVVVDPPTAQIDVGVGQSPTPIQFTATVNGKPVSPTWSLSPPTIGSISGSGLFTASGSEGGLATITAEYFGGSGSATVTVRLHLSQNGYQDGGTMGVGVGGIGGVGGEGEGPMVDPPTLTVLSTPPTADSTLSMLYPYDATVWPRDLLAPLLQWQSPTHLADAVAIHLECPALVWDGTFGPTASPFIHHPIPQAAWDAMSTACAGQSVSLRVVLASGGVAYGPLTETWSVSNGSLKGVVYYNSYGTSLALNLGGALPDGRMFGGATLAVQGGSTNPVLIAGKTGTQADCRVCHTVSSDGSTLLSQHGDDYSETSSYALKSGNAETPMSPDDGRYVWGGLSPDGGLLFSNSAPLFSADTADSALFQVPSGTAVSTTGLPTGFRAGTPVFSPDGTHLAFNFYGGASGSASGDQHTLAMMRFTPPGTFSELTPLFTPPSGQTAMYPSFLPDETGVVFENETQDNGRGDFGETRSSCDNTGPCSEVGAHGELWWVELASGTPHRLDKLNGLGYVPAGPNAHDDDTTLNYEPTVSPIAAGGYAWVIFTSRRLYGNVATINPWWSDPRFHDITQTPTPKKLWVAAIDLGAPAGTDPSHPAFYLPAQELLAGNSRGYWSLSPCMGDGSSCTSGDQCCGGYCRGPRVVSQVCSSTNTGCANEYEKCNTNADCCNAAGGATCVNGFCSGISLR